MRRGEYPDDWDTRRERVLDRDNYRCQECGKENTVLQVHHITPISEGGSHELDNLRSICRSCHAGEHPMKVKIGTALSNHQRIRMKYRSSSGTRVRELDPYALEMHEGIQYLVGHDHYRDEIRHFRPTRISWLEIRDIRFEPPVDFDAKSHLSSRLRSRRGKPGCFIATAAYGTATTDEIDLLRRFRDEELLTHRSTRWTVGLYYTVSPPIADWIAQTEQRRMFVRKYAVDPLVRVVDRFWRSSN
ncbi:hypothetical protein BRC98_01875 [Halobacteriales archaeon QS_7_68_65]|nr:MAG: hypothetical protein BRC98_01875 [Halobacteriales archaeon QS_7_68_65]